MKLTTRTLLALAVLTAPAALAQKWEVGGGAGVGYYSSQNITSPAGSAAAKFASNISASAWLASNSPAFLGGELRYDWQRGAAELSSGGAKASFSAMSHALHYDMVLHFASIESPVRPFVSAGGGVKIFQGTGTEVAYQPLNRIGLLTRTSDIKPLISLGGGVKFQIGQRSALRIEVHDFLTQFPGKVITPALNANAGGWLHDLVIGFGFSMLF
jgi:hypothetical protein